MNINEPPAATQPHFPYKSICTHKLQTTRVKMNREEEEEIIPVLDTVKT